MTAQFEYCNVLTVDYTKNIQLFYMVALDLTKQSQWNMQQSRSEIFNLLHSSEPPVSGR